MKRPGCKGASVQACRLQSLLGLLFLLSGACALGYEVVWLKVLSLHFGASAWSIASVLAAFMRSVLPSHKKTTPSTRRIWC